MTELLKSGVSIDDVAGADQGLLGFPHSRDETDRSGRTVIPLVREFERRRRTTGSPMRVGAAAQASQGSHNALRASGPAARRALSRWRRVARARDARDEDVYAGIDFEVF